MNDGECEEDDAGEDVEDDGAGEDVEDDGAGEDVEDDGDGEDVEEDGDGEDVEDDGAGEDVEDDGAGEDIEDDGDGEDDGYRKNNGASEEDSNEVDGDDEEEDENGSKSDLIDQVCAYLTTGKYKDSCDKNKKRMIRKKARFTMIGVLYYKMMKKKKVYSFVYVYQHIYILLHLHSLHSGCFNCALHSRGKGEEKDSSWMSCAPNIRSLRFDKNIVSLERKIHVAWLCKECFKNGMFLCTYRFIP